MKETAEERNEHARADFFDWWDGLESRVAHVDEKAPSTAEGARDGAHRVCGRLPRGRSR